MPYFDDGDDLDELLNELGYKDVIDEWRNVDDSFVGGGEFVDDDYLGFSADDLDESDDF